MGDIIEVVQEYKYHTSLQYVKLISSPYEWQDGLYVWYKTTPEDGYPPIKGKLKFNDDKQGWE